MGNASKEKDHFPLLSPGDFMNSAVSRFTNVAKRTRVRAIPGGMDSQSSRRY